MGQLRSINARMAGDVNVLDPLMNSMVLSYAKHVRANWKRCFRPKGFVAALKAVRTRIELQDDEDPAQPLNKIDMHLS